MGSPDIVAEKQLRVYLGDALREVGKPQVHFDLHHLIKELKLAFYFLFAFSDLLQGSSVVIELSQVLVSEVVDEDLLGVGRQMGIVSEEAPDEVLSQKLIVVNHLDKIDFKIHLGFDLVQNRSRSDRFGGDGDKV